jgi:hypothetical protein
MGNGKGPKARENLFIITGEADFELACKGWDLQDVIKTEDDENIENECTICGQTHLNDNFLIKYVKNGAIANVGSSCIKRFIKFNGISNQQDSNRFFDTKCNEINNIKTLKQLFYEIFSDPVGEDVVRRFRKSCARIMDVQDLFSGTYKTDKWYKLIDNLNAVLLSKITPIQEERIRLVLYDPHKLNVSERKKAKKDIYYDSKKPKARITTTLSRSDIYRNPSQIFEEAESQ